MIPADVILEAMEQAKEMQKLPKEVLEEISMHVQVLEKILTKTMPPEAYAQLKEEFGLSEEQILKGSISGALGACFLYGMKYQQNKKNDTQLKVLHPMVPGVQ